MKKTQLVYGSKVSPFTGRHEVVKNGRLVVYQNEFPELDEDIPRDVILTRIYAPIDMLATLREQTSLPYDTDFFFPCLILQGDSQQALEMIQNIFPDLELLNSDDSEVFTTHLAPSDQIPREDWKKIIEACKGTKWYFVLEVLMARNNQPQHLGEIDNLIKQKIPSTKYRYPSQKAMRCLNRLWSEAKLPFRIQKVEKGEHCYAGTIQVRRIQPK